MRRGYDVLAETRHRWRDRIREFHAKENLLGHGCIGFRGGRIQIEGPVPNGQPLVASHAQNVRFMRAHFS